MKKLSKICLLLILFLLIGGLIISIFPNSFAKEESYNSKILKEVLELENLAKQYIEESGSSLKSSELCFQYLRRNRYSDTKWNTLLGTIDNNFINYVNNNGEISLSDNEVLLDIDNKEVDFIHMIAVLNCYYKYGEAVRIMNIYNVSTDYAGWAGDLLTFLEEICNYRIENNIQDSNLLLEYANSLLGTNTDSSFSRSDMIADLDALNLYNDDSLNLDNLYDALYKYYVSFDNNLKQENRVSNARNFIGQDEVTIKTKASTLLKNSFVQNFLVSGLAAKVSDVDYEVVTSSFANYMLEKGYLKLSSSIGSGVVSGDDIVVDLVESNLGKAKITMTNNICKCRVENDTLVITPLEAGDTIISVASFNGSATATYSLHSSNIVPSIVKDLESEYSLSNGIESKIKIEALGTNNLYSWYMSDNVDGEFVKIEDTRVNVSSFKPTLDMNGKYIKCVISNVGNDEVTSRVAKIEVKDVSIGDIVDTGDKTLLIAVAIILVVVVCNIIVFVVRRINRK